MFTRTKDKANKIKFDLDVMSHSNNYVIEKAGNGKSLAYMKNPNIRLQRWGANVRTNMIGIEDDLRGQTRILNRDTVNENDYKKKAAITNAISYETTSIKNTNTKTDANRCEVRDKCLKNGRKDILYNDPQKNIRYVRPTSTRYVEKWERGFQ